MEPTGGAERNSFTLNTHRAQICGDLNHADAYS